MGNNRDFYFDKHIRDTKTAADYIQALKDSPYRTHRRMAAALEKQFPDYKTAKDQHANSK